MRNTLFLPILLLALLVSACDLLEPYNPTPVAIVITNIPTQTPIPSATPTVTPTATPTLTPTPNNTPTATPFPCEEAGGQIIDFRENVSPTARENIRYRVYVPPCYFASQKRFPVVYLFHGLSYREQQWTDIGIEEALNDGILSGQLSPMIVVMPYLATIGTMNQFPPSPSWETVVLEELMPQVERNFCTINTRTHRAIAGISRGGLLAFSIAMRHPETFSIVAGHSGYFPNNLREIPAAFNPLELAATADLSANPLRIYMDNGARDSSNASQQLLSSRLASNNIPHTYVVHPIGEHNNDYWRSHIGEYVTFYAQSWERNYLALPSCVDPSP